MVSVERVKSILFRPQETWAVIDKEPATTGSIYNGWVIPLAAIGPVASLIGWVVFGASIAGVAIRMPIGSAVTFAVVSYVGALISVFLLALIIDALAPSFDGKKNQIQA